MRNKSNSKRTEATLSLLVTSALVITLAIAVASAIKKGNVNEENNNYVNLNETEAPGLSADNSQSQNSTKNNSVSSKSTEDILNNIVSDNHNKTSDSVDNNSTTSEENNTDSEKTADDTSDNTSDVPVALDDAITTEYSFSEADTLIMPAAGEIVLPYNMDNTIWFPTLSVYKCNPGLYIAGEVGSEVVASASGRVASITKDEEYGNVVTLDMGNGYVSSYGMLGDINVSEGEVVLAGSPIGTVGEPTIYFTTEGSGIYFKLTKDNAPANPLDYME